jgi:acyl carrier protein
MTADADIFETVVSVLRRACGVQVEVSSDTRLAEDLGLDSVGLLALALELENHYQLQLGEDPASPPRTVGDVVALIAEGLRVRETPR